MSMLLNASSRVQLFKWSMSFRILDYDELMKKFNVPIISTPRIFKTKALDFVGARYISGMVFSMVHKMHSHFSSLWTRVSLPQRADRWEEKDRLIQKGAEERERESDTETGRTRRCRPQSNNCCVKELNWTAHTGRVKQTRLQMHT